MKTNEVIALGVAVAIAASLQGASAASPPIAYAELRRYPGADKAGITVFGTLYVTNNGGAMRVFGDETSPPFLNYQPDPTVVECTTCGVHIHVGVSCDDESRPGGHFFTADSDPWLNTTFSSL